MQTSQKMGKKFQRRMTNICDIFVAYLSIPREKRSYNLTSEVESAFADELALINRYESFQNNAIKKGCLKDILAVLQAIRQYIVAAHGRFAQRTPEFTNTDRALTTFVAKDLAKKCGGETIEKVFGVPQSAINFEITKSNKAIKNRTSMTPFNIEIMRHYIFVELIELCLSDEGCDDDCVTTEKEMKAYNEENIAIMHNRAKSWRYTNQESDDGEEDIEDEEDENVFEIPSGSDAELAKGLFVFHIMVINVPSFHPSSVFHRSEVIHESSK
jgi:hypothetical protein